MSESKQIIAIVDDDASVRKALRRVLCAAGFEARAFGSAEELLREAELGCHACLILDIQLPGMSGFELYHSLEARGVHLPTIFVTADETNWVHAADLHLSHMVCLHKPFPDSVLLGAVNAALR
jgi:FixJ family two-component response regulator